MEEWLPAPSFPEYEVSSLGRIKRVAGGMRGAQVGRILKPHCQPGGCYPMVGLWRNDRRVMRTVHSLVAEAFIGPYPPGKEVNHRDANKQNPRAGNLEYVTRKRNLEHARENGLMNQACGERSGSAVLKAEQVVAIREDARSMTYTEIAKKYDIDESRVSRICRGLLWASAGGPIWPKRRRGNNQYVSVLPAGPVGDGSK